GVGEILRRDRVTDLPGDRDRPDPGEGVRQVAKPFAEVDGRRVGVEGLCADVLRSGPAPFDTQSDGKNEFMLGALENPVSGWSIEVLESVGSGNRRIGWAEEGVGRAERHRKVLRDALGELSGNVALTNRRNVAGVEAVDGGKGQLVVDAGIVDRK